MMALLLLSLVMCAMSASKSSTHFQPNIMWNLLENMENSVRILCREGKDIP